MDKLREMHVTLTVIASTPPCNDDHYAAQEFNRHIARALETLQRCEAYDRGIEIVETDAVTRLAEADMLLSQARHVLTMAQVPGATGLDDRIGDFLARKKSRRPTGGDADGEMD